MANLLLRLTCGKIKQLKKLGIVHLEARKGQRLYAYYASVSSDWKKLNTYFNKGEKNEN
ncbi:hypothetical protein [Helicobacter pylori]|uniref:Uncharacterized protein n=1 Tax=Helicobacter pylori GAM100Ai TaxID=1159019 RepID=A0AB72ZS29_HELPX|nr:hypothetical protein [Helicobacter pylori]EKQ71427.1 hypothetical protein HMPREF1391_01636 [Helicobacter pylori GAM100Ai]